MDINQVIEFEDVMNAVSVSRPIKARLTSGRGETHSVYDKAINVILEDGSLIALVDHLQGGGPFSITLDIGADFSFRNIPIKEHDRVYLKPNAIEIGGSTIASQKELMHHKAKAHPM